MAGVLRTLNLAVGAEEKNERPENTTGSDKMPQDEKSGEGNGDTRGGNDEQVRSVTSFCMGFLARKAFLRGGTGREILVLCITC